MTSLTLVRRITARPQIVFDALTTGEGLASWWGPDDLPVIHAAIDARIGGEFCVRFNTLDGDEHESSGEILELAPPHRLVMSWRWTFGGPAEEQGTTSRILFELKPLGEGSELTFTHDGLSDAASQASHAWGWAGSLTKLVLLFAEASARRDRA